MHCVLGVLSGYSRATKNDVALHMVFIGRLLVTCDIDAQEKRDVTTSDLPGAFLHVGNDEYIIKQLQGKLVEMMA